MIGKTISHYKIIETLGAGGMGVVYKAEDTKLHRIVALKFLPPELTRDEEVKKRFIIEAQAASSLQHHNVCTIHDIDETADGQMFIIMDYYEGETLKEKITKGPPKIDEALNFAIQIAEGLQKAHENRIIHRDIKPANIFITNEGIVKILDFGLAKLTGQSIITKIGSTVGTIAYMSPEQARGEEVDQRTDIWSLGVVFYEMLTGKLPFQSDYEQAVIYSIVNEEPKPMQQYIPDAPSELLHILARTLEKDREERYQIVHDMLIDLRRLKKDYSRVLQQPHYEVPASGTGVLVPAVENKKHLSKRLRMIVAGLVVLCVISMLYLILKTSPVRLNPNRSWIMLKIPFKEITSLGLSQDGNWLVYSAVDEKGKQDVYWMNIAGGKPTRITEELAVDIGGVDPSPDASRVAYGCYSQMNGVYKVKLVSTHGGGSITLADTGIGPQWRRDGQRIGYIRMGISGEFPSASGKLEIWSVMPDGRDRRLELIDTLAARPSPWAFCWSPDGGSIAWVRNYPGPYGEIMVRELGSGRERQLTSDGKSVNDLSWATNDQIFFPSNRSGANNLWMIPACGGEATQVTEGGVPIRESRISGDNSTLVFRHREWVTHLWISALDGSNASQISSDDVQLKDAEISPDGKQIAYVTSDVDISNPEAHLYVMRHDGKNQRQLTFGSEIVSQCKWSPNGKFLAYSSRFVVQPNDSTRIYLIQPNNPGSPRLLCKGSLFAWVDSERIVTYHEGRSLIYVIKGDIPIQVYKDSTFAIPIKDNKQFFILDYRKGREGWWVVSLDAMGRETVKAKKLLPSNIDLALHPDGRFFIYIKQGDEMYRVWTSNGKEERIGTAPPRLLPWTVSMDGREILWFEDFYPSKLVLVKNVFE
jgi:serine/threonine protein kinase/Tol biopolymer transport system component